MGEKKVNQIIPDLNCTKQKCQRNSIGIDIFCIVIISIVHFMWLSLSLPLPLSRIHTYMQWIFGFCCHEIWILLFFCLSSNPFQLFFYKKNLELLAFCFDLDIFVSIKKRKRLTQIKCDSSITKLSSFSIILYFMPESWTNKEEKRKFERFHTIFCMIRLSKRFFLRWLPFEILYIQFSKYGANEKGLTHPPPPPPAEWRKTKQVERNLMPQYSFVYFWGFTVSNFLFVLPHNDDPFHFSWFVQKNIQQQNQMKIKCSSKNYLLHVSYLRIRSTCHLNNRVGFIFYHQP